MFAFIFYLFAILAFLYHFTRATRWSKHSMKRNNFNRIQLKIPKFQYMKKEDREKGLEKDSPDLKIMTDYSHEVILFFLYVSWSVIGIFSSQWILFIILWTWLIVLPTKWLSPTFMKGFFYNLGMVIKHFVAMIIVLAIVINKYHLHINLLEIIKQMIF